jgi:hypothetical protein
MIWSPEEYDEALLDLDVLRLGVFSGISEKIEHQCLKCEAQFEAFPDNILRGRQRCPICSSKRRRLTTESYNELLNPRNIILLEALGKQQTKHVHQCTSCTYEWSTTPDNVLRRNSGCPACSKDQANSGWKKRTPVKVGKRVVHLQGYEPQAVKYLQSVGCLVEKLLFNTDEGKPTFKYKYSKKDCLYIPDFYYPPKNRVVEVKSSWTLVQTLDIFRRNCAKAKSVLSNGYDFRLLVLSESGSLIKMPKEWYLMRFADIKGIVSKRCT